MKKGVPILTFILSAVLIVLLYNICSGNGAASVTSHHQQGKVYKIVIDPGHGGKDHGATGASGRLEKDFTLQLARKVEELAKQEPRFEVYLTRTDDGFLSSIDRERPEFANQLGADLFISIHGNTYEDPSVSGTETYYYHEDSLSLAEIMQKHMVQANGFRDRGVKKEDFFVVKDTNMPAVLIEMGYLTNPQEEKEMLTEEVQYRMANSILDGIKEVLKLT
ncbi:N-acetylmuramoyl-L-alanine amidase [Brevibacillus ruminantium]|uniref:N-acetylmuramoyl-L-alanine amidase n=1 Tax=Brevibacillus ruminantium TaxID=2950604 RepID=A0ABY4WLH3_9BACL|nr:N-acetylmuramoyl-L-alanine amidase [Brevibacillus ruminantium]USG67893.1 N-acetylmuramoyl-L-alanine amidase [Brevibacillus ruminantium]